MGIMEDYSKVDIEAQRKHEEQKRMMEQKIKMMKNGIDYAKIYV